MIVDLKEFADELFKSAQQPVAWLLSAERHHQRAYRGEVLTYSSAILDRAGRHLLLTVSGPVLHDRAVNIAIGFAESTMRQLIRPEDPGKLSEMPGSPLSGG